MFRMYNGPNPTAGPNTRTGKEMPRNHQTVNLKKFMVIAAVILAGIAGVVGYRLGSKPETAPAAPETPKEVLAPIKPESVIDYNQIEKDQALQELMQKRKAKYGLEKGVDIITKSDETLKIGDSTVSMQEILDKIRIKSGDIVEKNLGPDGAPAPGEIKELGIYVVQANDNIWNIHFNFLKDYFDNKGVALSPMADEPKSDGLSSGVGKILKFSENTVQIYNVKEGKLDVDLNLIIPLSKIVVYNMDRIFKLLDLIDYEQVDHIQFDGETLWIPAK